MNIFQSGNNNVCTINGVDYVGRNVNIIGNKVVIDGVTQDQVLTGPIYVTVNGDVDRIESGSGDIMAINVGSISTASGDVKCYDVLGSINTASGDVMCKNIKGNVNTISGDITS